jgi:hypothetical protein
VIDPAEEVVLDPVLVNPLFMCLQKSYSCANCKVGINRPRRGGGVSEVDAYKRDDNQAKSRTRRMRGLDKQRVAKCDRPGPAIGKTMLELRLPIFRK